MTTSPNGRLSFSKHLSTIPLPNMIQVQRTSYEEFLQMNLLPEERLFSGLQSVLSSIFPFTDFRETCELQFVRYEIGNWTCRCKRLDGLQHLRLTCGHCGASFRAGDPHEELVVCPECGKANKNQIETCSVCGTSVGLRLKFSAEECRERGMTYSVPVRLTFRLVTFDIEEDGSRQVRDVKEEELYFGEMPLMTDTGTFIINGTERVIVSQLHRSPGVFFTLEGPNDYLAKVVPYRGSWIEFEYDNKQILWVRIDRKRRLPGSVFLRALSPELETNSQILRGFHIVFDVRLSAKKDSATLMLDSRILDIETERQKALRFRKVAEPTLFAGLSLDKNMRKRLEKATVDKPTKVAVTRDDLLG
ncbi:MAG: DNA-directed RNA polymerase subunit beta, partial [Acidobacteria bacterium]|nr:DNA-directed RNA polymerase subunit beta [Candidatus Sulfomarinibacter sp. MAG AM1]